jgi:ATP-dependent RNA helicase RhlE
MLFSELGLSPALLQALTPLGYETPTSIQTLAIPPALQGRDILATAQTGSGKTLAFALPLLQRGNPHTRGQNRQPQALVLVPTRELAVQVGETLLSLAQRLPTPFKVSVVFGGVSINPQMMALRGGTDVVVATTGRLLDLIDHNALTLSGVATLVLDEADRMLDLGFSEELQRILTLIPPVRQNLFFSATFPAPVQTLARTLLNDPVRVEVAAQEVQPLDIQQRAIAVDPARRTQLLRKLIETSGWDRVLVFVATKHAAEIVADKLRKASLNAEPFHGELSQGKRTQVLQDFKASRLTVVVATDMAARGLDIAQLPVVVNYDLPRSAVDYTHRIGRTGRAGHAGLAISFVSAGTEAHFRLIERRQGMPVAREEIAGFEPTEAAPATDAQLNGGIKGQRPSKKDKLRAAALAAGPATK